MNNSKTINFSGLKVSKVFHNNTKQYEALNKLTEGQWNVYSKTMTTKNKIRVKYDTNQDAYILTPINETQMKPDKKYLLQDEDEDDDGIDMEQDALELINAIDISDESPELPSEDAVMPPELEPAPSAQVANGGGSIDLAQFEALLNKVLGNGSVKENPSASLPPQQQTISTGSFANNVLETEFEANSENLSYIEDKIESGSYMSQIDPKYNAKKSIGAIQSEEPQSIDIESELGMDSDSDLMLPDIHQGEEDETEELNEWGASENDEYGHYGEQTGQLTEDDDDSEATDEDDVYNDDDTEIEYEPEDEDEDEAITAKGVANFGGQAVQIILTGVMITPSEIGYVAESAKKSGMKLKAVKGAGKTVNFIVESKGKTYTIKYQDTPKYKTKTPFSIKNYTFQTLDEAFKTISTNNKKTIREAKNFKKFMTDDIANRSITDIKESNILKEFEGKISKNYIAGWNIKAVGSINLKSGLNEVYSNVTEHSNEVNTLVKTDDGQYYLLKGNLKERSAVGTKRQLSDIDGQKVYGVGTVVGLYENSLKGLGQIMYKVKRTSLPLLSWK